MVAMALISLFVVLVVLLGLLGVGFFLAALGSLPLAMNVLV